MHRNVHNFGHRGAKNTNRVCGRNIRMVPPSISNQELLALVEMKLSGDQSGCGRGKEETELPIELEGIIAVSLPMRAVLRRISDAAKVDIPVLVTGETGTGKDLVAAAIHRRSMRRHKPYIAINMGAIPRNLIADEIFGHDKGAYTGAQETRPGIFEQAHGGTVFLDEIGTTDEKTQIALLRVLEEKTFRRVGGLKNIQTDARIIAATNENLENAVEEKRFREDLFYRLNVFPIRVPSLRERRSAIATLANYFISRFASLYGKAVDSVAPETYRLLRHYSWPGNVRELKNVIQTAVLILDGKKLTPDFLPQRLREALPDRGHSHDSAVCPLRVGATLNDIQNELIRMTLAHVSGNKKLAATMLGISRRALYSKIKRHQCF